MQGEASKMDVDTQKRDDDGFDGFQAAVRDKGLEPGVEKFRCSESAEQLLRRFLTASAGDTKAAVKLLAEDLEFREEMDTLSLSAMSCDQVLQLCKCPHIKPTIIDFLPHGFLGFDKAGRPVSYRKITGKFDANKLAQAGFDYDANLKYSTWILERMCKAMGDVGQWVVIVDMSEWSLWQFAPSNMALANQVATLSTKHFPERMGSTLIINAPYVFNACWQVAKGWLNERIISKIGIYGGPDQWRPELEKMMDLETLPEELGGKARLSYAPHSLDPSVQPQPREQN
mmetsp:Transcript_56125/g.132223  ORF Transcript_56125/g.132223 Transcript_56125/m.132223 type:complete len:286 (-) Transcript_56125:17-874(-)